MNRHRFAAAMIVLLLAGLLPGLFPASFASTRAGFSMEILVDGIPLQEYPARGSVYIQALRGREYAVRLRNHTGERIAVALSVDGLNSIDAKTTTALAGSKWVLGPWESIVIEGWQTSSASARRFFFTTEERSYGSWLGRTKNLGVLTAAFFRERSTSPCCGGPYDRPIDRGEGTRRVPGSRSGASSGDEDAARAPQPAQAPGDEEGQGARAGAKERSASPRENGPESRMHAEKSDAYAATGIGREIDHGVRTVLFEEQPAPAAVLEVRYEFHDALVRLGVLPRRSWRQDPLERRERASGFEDTGFAPDPYRR